MKSQMMLWKKLADESASWCCTSATMDFKTVQVRCEHEGFSFLTITLPKFGKDLQKGLDRGWVDRDLFTGFQWRAGLPVFLRGFLDRVFDRSSGVLLDAPCIDAILAVRQLTLLYDKISLPCSDTRVRKAMRGYIDCENDVREVDSSMSSADLADFKRVSSLLFASIFSKVDSDIYYGKVVPKHGPGSTADKLRGNAKYRNRAWTQRLEKLFPAGEFLLPNWRFLDQYADVDIVEPGSEMPVQVISVPKTLKTPRIIAMEPTSVQYVQQGIYEILLKYLESDDKLNRLIGFDDQTPNQRMALEGSCNGTLATLDLSDASDRVSNQLVRLMLVDHPHLHGAVDACRSRKADVPGQGVVRLAKFASMGSALTFPMEAMVFTTLIFLGIERELNTPLSKKSIKAFLDKVRVYGDDIIVPVEYVQSIVSVLETFGSRVNTGKSFWTGKFRESCGRDYYDGSDVSVVRAREVFPTQRTHATGIISMVSLRNQLYQAGYWRTCSWLDDEIRAVIRYFPVVLPTSPVLGRHSFLGYQPERFDEHLHSPQVRGYVVSSRSPSDPLDGPGALLKFLIKRGGLPSVDIRHLERAGRPHAVNIKLRWASAV